MEIRHLRAVVAVADEMHFGRAAQRLELLPAALGRTIKQFEDGLGFAIFERTTRSVALTDEGARVIADARDLLQSVDMVTAKWRKLSRSSGQVLRLGAIDSAAAGIVPRLLHDLQEVDPTIRVQLLEDRTIRMVPKLLAGTIDLALVRPGLRPFNRRLRTAFLLNETPVVVLPATHMLASRDVLAIGDLADMPLVVPERKSRPHSHDLVISLFSEANVTPKIIQNADEKQTMLNMVAVGMGAAIMPRWWARNAPAGVVTRELDLPGRPGTHVLPLHVAWPRDVRNEARDMVIALLEKKITNYGEAA